MQCTKVRCATSTSEKCDAHLSKKAKARCTYLLLLNRLVDKERRAERGLLRDLLRLDRVCELGREVDVGDGDVVEDEVEAQRAAREVLADEAGDLGVGLGKGSKGHASGMREVDDSREGGSLKGGYRAI